MYGFARTMAINARVISEPDPGAIPGGSTTLSRVIGGDRGADQHRRACKGVAFARYGTAASGHFLTANDNFAGEVRLAA